VDQLPIPRRGEARAASGERGPERVVDLQALGDIVEACAAGVRDDLADVVGLA
jgi:hypothetical protein